MSSATTWPACTTAWTPACRIFFRRPRSPAPSAPSYASARPSTRGACCSISAWPARWPASCSCCPPWRWAWLSPRSSPASPTRAPFSLAPRCYSACSRRPSFQASPARISICILATALNLLPIGQLDGGHILYALAGDKHKLISKVFILLLVPLGVFYWWVWLFWAAILFWLGRRHPVIYDTAELGAGRVRLGYTALVIFVLCFTLAPVSTTGL